MSLSASEAREHPDFVVGAACAQRIAFRQISYWLKGRIYYGHASPLPIYLQIRDAPVKLRVY
jgi:hypothetical protein